MSNFYPIGNAALVKERVVSAGPCRVMGLLGSNVGAACILQVFDRAQAKALTTTGDTHSNTTLDNLAAATVAKLKLDTSVAGSGIPAGTTIVGFPNTTSVTLSAAATATASGVPITFRGISDGDVPMFEVTASAGTPTEPANWTFLPPSPVDLDACTVKASSTQGALTLLTTNRVSIQGILAMLLALLALAWPAGAQVGGNVGSPRTTTAMGLGLNVKNFGAVGDGVTDDTAAIQAALDYAGTNAFTSGDVFFTAGKYRITTNLTFKPNDDTSQLMPQRGPYRLYGQGSASSVIFADITNGCAINLLNLTTNPTLQSIIAPKFERLGIMGPLVQNWDTANHIIGVNCGWLNDIPPLNQYRNMNVMFQDCQVSGFERAITVTNVWGFTVDNCTFHSNRLSALTFSKTHSVTVRNSTIRGVDAATRMGGTAIAFIAPAADVNGVGLGDSSWGFGDTALLMNNNILFYTNCVYNNELGLVAFGENYQFSPNFWEIRSGWRTNVTGGSTTNIQCWRPWAYLNMCIMCDSGTKTYWTNGYPAQCTTDSETAPNIVLDMFLGDVCSATRPVWNVVGTSNFCSGNNGYFVWGSTNHFAQPHVRGGTTKAGMSALWNGSNSVTFGKTLAGWGVTNGHVNPLFRAGFLESAYNSNLITGAALTISNGGNPYVPQLLVLEGGQGTAREAAIGLGGDYDRAGYSASYPHVGSIHGYTVANPYYTVPDVQLLSYSAFSNRVWLGIGATPGYVASAKGLQEIRFYTASATNTTATLRGGFNTNGGFSLGSVMDQTNSSVTVVIPPDGSMFRVGTNQAIGLVVNGANQVGIGKVPNQGVALDVGGAIVCSSSVMAGTAGAFQWNAYGSATLTYASGNLTINNTNRTILTNAMVECWPRSNAVSTFGVYNTNSVRVLDVSSNCVMTDGLLLVKTNALTFVVPSGYGGLWNSNGYLFGVSATKTNPVVDLR